MTSEALGLYWKCKKHSEALLKKQARLLKLLETFVIWHGTDDHSRQLYYDQLNQALIEARKLVQK